MYGLSDVVFSSKSIRLQTNIIDWASMQDVGDNVVEILLNDIGFRPQNASSINAFVQWTSSPGASKWVDESSSQPGCLRTFFVTRQHQNNTEHMGKVYESIKLPVSGDTLNLRSWCDETFKALVAGCFDSSVSLPASTTTTDIATAKTLASDSIGAIIGGVCGGVLVIAFAGIIFRRKKAAADSVKWREHPIFNTGFDMSINALTSPLINCAVERGMWRKGWYDPKSDEEAQQRRQMEPLK